MTCEQCGDQGFYFDQACLDNTCAHGERELSARERAELAKNKPPATKVPWVLPRVMPCPSRPCSCPAGEAARAWQRERIRLQSERLKRANA